MGQNLNSQSGLNHQSSAFLALRNAFTCNKIIIIVPAVMLVCLLSARMVVANGWEHGAVAYQDLISALVFDDVATRGRAVRSLGIRRQPEAVDPLLNLLKREASVSVRDEIYSALGKIGSQNTITPLIECLERKEEEETLRATCATALAAVGGEASLGRLLTAVASSSFLVRSAAVTALGHFADVRAVKMLERVYQSSNHSLKARALTALAATGIKQSAHTLLAALLKAEDDASRLIAVKGLGNSGAKIAI